MGLNPVSTAKYGYFCDLRIPLKLSKPVSLIVRTLRRLYQIIYSKPVTFLGYEKL